MSALFLVGLALLLIGFLMVWRSRLFEEYIGDISTLLSTPGTTWLDWNVIGIILMLLGVLLVFGILPKILEFIFGNFLTFSF